MILNSLNRNIYEFSHAPLTSNQVKSNCAEKIEKKSVSKNVTSASQSASGFFSAKNDVAFTGGKTKTFTDIAGKVFEGTEVETRLDRWLKSDKAEKFLTNKFFIKLSDYAEKAPGAMETISSLAIVCSLRPGAILLTPGAEKRDKQYAAARSWASGFIDLGFTVALLTPIKIAYEKFEGTLNKTLNIANNKKFLNLENKAAKDANKFLMNFGPKFVITPLRAVITIAAIPPIMKAIFPKRTKKEIQEKNLNEPPIYSYPINVQQKNIRNIDMVVFKSFLKGGK